MSGLLAEFFASLADALPPDKGDRLKLHLGNLLQVAAPVASVIPGVGSVASDLVAKLGEKLAEREPWSKAFDAASQKLRALETPVLVVADDIDRLQTDELLVLLKVVRLLGRFPGVHYLLAYDETTIRRAIAGAPRHADADIAGNYMEKIVQYPLVVPPLLQTQLLDRLLLGIDDASNAAGRRQLRGSERISQLLDVYRALLTTPRAIDRYVAQLRHLLPIVPQAEINDIDVAILTLVRTALPSVFAELPRYRDELTSGHIGQLARGTDSDIRMERFDVGAIVGSVTEQMRPFAQRLLRDLFPKLLDDRDRTVTLFGDDTSCSIRSVEYFDRYFALGVPAHDVPDQQVADAVHAAVSDPPEPLPLRDLLTNPSSTHVTLAISKAVSCFPVPSGSDKQRARLVQALVPIVDKISNESTVLTSPRRQVTSWIAANLNTLNDVPVAEAIRLLELTDDVTIRVQILLSLEGQPAWLPEVASYIADAIRPAALRHFVEKDSASTGADGDLLLVFMSMIASDGDRVALRSDLAKCLDNGTLDPADIAARFVYFVFEDRPSFNQEAFAKIAPAESIPDSWFDTPADENYYPVSRHSWPSRRKYATGAARRPSRRN